MKLTITNKSRGAVGVRPVTGYVEISPGGEFSGDFSDAEAANLRTNSLVEVSGGDDGEAPAKSDLDIMREKATEAGIDWREDWSLARLRKEVKKVS